MNQCIPIFHVLRNPPAHFTELTPLSHLGVFLRTNSSYLSRILIELLFAPLIYFTCQTWGL